MAIHKSKTPGGLDRGDYLDSENRPGYLEVTAAGKLLFGPVSLQYLELTQAEAGDLGTLLTNFSSTGTFDPPPP